MKRIVVAACASACGCVSTPPPPACALRVFDEFVTSPGGGFASPWLSSDHDDLYFVSQAQGGIVHATRASADDAFGFPTALVELAGIPNVVRFWLSWDELEIWIVTQGGPFYFASRTNANAAFTAPAQIDSGEQALSITADDLVAFYTRGDGTPRVATRTDTTQMFDFGNFTAVPGLPTCDVSSCATDPSGATLYCVVAADGTQPRRIVRANNDLAGYTPQAVYTVTALDAELSPPVAAEDFDPMIDADERSLVFASTRAPGSSATPDLWAYCE